MYENTSSADGYDVYNVEFDDHFEIEKNNYAVFSSICNFDTTFLYNIWSFFLPIINKTNVDTRKDSSQRI